MCGDGTGGPYLMTDIGTFTDPNLNASTDLSTSVVQLEFDPQTGARTATDILARTTDETQVIACDGVAPEAGGLVYVPEFFNVDFPATPCSRDSREALTAVSKSTGPPVVIVADIAAAAGYGECDDFDPTADLEVTRDGSAIFASLPLTGLSRIRPTPLPISPDIIYYFQVHPDGSIIYVTTSDAVGTGSLNIFKISPEQAVAGVQRLAELTPCVVQVPNNCVRFDGSTAGPCPADPNDVANRGGTLLGLSSFAVGRAAAAARAPAGAGGEPAARRRVPRRSRARHGGGSHLDAPAASRTEGAGVRTNDLSRFLAARGWTDGQLAARTALDRAHVNQLKNGRALPTVATALVIAEALGVTVDAVFPPGSVVRRRRMR